MANYAPKTLATFQVAEGRRIVVPIKPADIVNGFKTAALYPGGASAPLDSTGAACKGQLVVVTPFNAGTSLTVSFGTAAAPTGLLAATSLAAAGVTAVSEPALSNVAQPLGVTFALTGAPPTQGFAYLILPYEDAHTQFVYGNELEPNL